MELRCKVTKYNSETGEVLSQQDYAIEQDNLILNSDNKMFTKLLCTKEPKFSKTVYLGYWYRLVRFLEYNTNILAERKKKTNSHWLESIHMSARRIQEILEVSYTTFYRFMKECNEKGFIAECKNKCTNEAAFIVSPIYALNGQGISVELYQYFRGIPEIEAALSEKDKKMIKMYLDIDVEENK